MGGRRDEHPDISDRHESRNPFGYRTHEAVDIPRRARYQYHIQRNSPSRRDAVAAHVPKT